MANAPSHTHPFEGFDRSVEHALGADMRLLYGMAAPILMVIGVIVLLALNPATWLVIAVLLLEVACLALVVYGFVGLLDEPGDQDLDHP
jgi:hypothetical protein